MARTTDAVRILESTIRDDPIARARVAKEELGLRIAEGLLAARTAAGMSQQQLALRAGTTQSVISRVEDAEYRGHSLELLQRIASALELELDVTFTPIARRKRRG